MRALGHSVWLMPSGDPQVRLNRRIAALSERLDTRPFPAHVTVAGQLDLDLDALSEKLRAIARVHARLALTLEHCAGEERWFRCLFHHVGRTPELEALHEAVAGPTAWTPHLSICYGDLPVEKKAPIMADAKPPVGGFVADSLHLWRTDGPVDAWRPLAVFPLG